MMIKSNTEKHTLRWLERSNNKGLLDFNIAIQRKEVWDLKHKSNLIASTLIGIPIESLLIEEETNSEGYLVLDGKQRSSAFLQYFRDEFALSQDILIKEVEGESIVGKKFSELSENLKDSLKEMELTFSVLRPLSEDEREVIFFMRNQAVALTRVELNRVLLGSRIMNELQTICNHKFLDKTNISRSRYVDQQIVLECMLLESGKDYGFSGNDMSRFVEELKVEGCSTELFERVISVMDYLDRAIEVKNRALRKLHVPMVYSVAKQAMKDNLAEESFGLWINKFFKDIKGDTNEYTIACSNGSANKSNVQKRLNYIHNHYNENRGDI